LAYAGSYIFSAHIPPQTYLEFFESQRDNLLRKNVSEGLEDYKGTVLTTWGISYAFILRQSPNAAKLLIFLSFLDPENLQYDLFRRGTSLDGPEYCTWIARLQDESLYKRIADILRLKGRRTIKAIPWLKDLVGSEIKFRETITTLIDFSLVTETRSQDCLQMHAIVRDWCQLREPKADIALGFDAMCLVRRAVDTNMGEPENHDDWQRATQGAPHIPTFLKFLASSKGKKIDSFLKDMTVLYALNIFAEYLNKSGKSGDAVDLLKLVCDQLRQVLGAGSRLTAF